MKKVKFTAFIMVIAFILMGAGYAAWTDTTEINGTITTGWLDVIFENPGSNDSDGVNDPGMLYDVGKTKATIIGDDKKTLQVEITNGYPGYNSQVEFSLRNDSTIPVKVKEVVIQKDYDNELLVGFDAVNALVGTEIGVGASLDNIIITNEITENAQQNDDYSYTVTITFQQWNID